MPLIAHVSWVPLARELWRALESRVRNSVLWPVPLWSVAFELTHRLSILQHFHVAQQSFLKTVSLHSMISSTMRSLSVEKSSRFSM